VAGRRAGSRFGHADDRDLIDRVEAVCQEAAEVRSQFAAVLDQCRWTREQSQRVRDMPNMSKPPKDK